MSETVVEKEKLKPRFFSNTPHLSVGYYVKFLAIFGVFLFLVNQGLAQETTPLKDVPAKHWAGDSINYLVKLGVTSGYPDGTFRGKKPVSRYEAAVMLAKLAKTVGADSIKSDLETLKNEIASVKKTPDLLVTGNVEILGQLTNILATEGISDRGPISSYRYIGSFEKQLAENANIKITVDTMDAGYYGSPDLNFPRQMLDIVSKISLDPDATGLSMIGLKDPLKVELTFGPDYYQHVDTTGLLPSENGVTYLRPAPGISLGTNILGLNMSGAYYVENIEDSGKVNTNHVSGAISHTLSSVPWIDSVGIELIADYYLKNPHSSGPSDKRASLNLTLPFNQKVQAVAKFGMGKTDSKGWMVGGELKLEDLWNTGTQVMVKGSKIGSEFVDNALWDDELGTTGFDVFMRPILNAQVDIGGEITQALSDKLFLKGKGDIRLSPAFAYGKEHANTSLTAQVGVAYDLAPDTNFDAYYKLYQDPVASETTDLAAMGLLYKF